jgi:cholera toxin transcriptional activator
MLNYASSAMSTPPTSPNGRLIRFGVFEADLAAAELRKSGVRIRLQEQPFQVLAYLLNHPGEVVTREELRQKLWPADTFVDFDHSLNTAVNKLREALGDSAASPRYVETLARRGYRFVAPVQAAEAAIPVAAKDPAPAPSAPIHPELELPLPHRGITRGLFGLIQIMYLIFYLAALFRLNQVDRIAESFLPGWGSFALVVAVLVTGGIGIILRCYLLSAVSFDYARLREKFERIFLLILPLDQLWAAAPFLITEKIGFGAAFAVTAALLYVPFAERTLLRMAYPKGRN